MDEDLTAEMKELRTNMSNMATNVAGLTHSIHAIKVIHDNDISSLKAQVNVLSPLTVDMALMQSKVKTLFWWVSVVGASATTMVVTMLINILIKLMKV